jgi:membrane dipeptidase
LRRLSRYAPFGQVFAIFADSAKTPNLRESVEAQAALFRREKARHPELMSRAVLSIEGGELLDCNPERLYEAKARGVRWVNPTWNHANALSGSHAERPERGLSDTGRAFVRVASELGIFIDASHLSDRGFFDAADMGAALLASHSNSRAVCPHTRNLTDDQFRVIRDGGGFVGINLYRDFVGGDGSMEALLRHFERFLDMDGASCVGLGSDWDGGITGAGNLNGVEDMERLADAMGRRGYGRTLIHAIFYGNLSRFLGIA